MATLKADQLDLVASFFQERIETITAKGGSTVFVQRPKARAEGFTASAEDLPDDFDVLNISANSTQLYRISIGPLDIVLYYDLEKLGVEIAVKINIPILGSITIAHAKGNLKQGVSLHVGYKGIVSGEVGVKLNGTTVIVFWNLNAFGNTFNDEVELFTI